jgi:hypothetical protein
MITTLSVEAGTADPTLGVEVFVDQLEAVAQLVLVVPCQ